MSNQKYEYFQQIQDTSVENFYRETIMEGLLPEVVMVAYTKESEARKIVTLQNHKGHENLLPEVYANRWKDKKISLQSFLRFRFYDRHGISMGKEHDAFKLTGHYADDKVFSVPYSDIENPSFKRIFLSRSNISEKTLPKTGANHMPVIIKPVYQVLDELHAEIESRNRRHPSSGVERSLARLSLTQQAVELTQIQ